MAPPFFLSDEEFEARSSSQSLMEPCSVHQKRNRTSPETLDAHMQALSKAFTDLEMVMSRRYSLIDRESEVKIVLDDALFTDVQRCYKCANATVHTASEAMSPVMTAFPPLRMVNPTTRKKPGLPVSSRRPRPRHPGLPTGPVVKDIDSFPERGGTSKLQDSQMHERNSPEMDMDVHQDARMHQRDSCAVEPLSIRPKEVPQIEDTTHPDIIPGKEPEASNLGVQNVELQQDPFDDSNIKHQGSPIDEPSGKHRGSYLDESAANHQGSPDSEEDPEPDFKESAFPPAVYAEMIANLQQEVRREMKDGNYDKAELAHLKAIKHLTDREATLHIPYENEHRSATNETLAEIYLKQKHFDKAKSILHTLLKQEKADSDRKWRLYYMLAGVYLEQERLLEAEKYAKRAYIGRDKMLGKGHGLIIQSAAQLVQIFEAKGEPEAAQAFKNLYDPSSIQRNQEPQITKHIGTRRVQWNPDISIDINAPQKNGETPLITAVTCGDEEMLQHVLRSGADVEARGPDGLSPLMHAVWHGHEKIADVLISRGAKVDAPTAGWTPLHKACDMGNLTMVALLLANEADIEAKSPKKLVLKKGTPLDGKLAEPSWSSDEGDSDNSDADRGWTPLLRAANAGDEAIVRRLLDGNADIEARNPTKATPLICAAGMRHEAVVDLLLLRGANVEAEDEFGWKPLHRTLTTRGGEKVAQLLLNHNANINCVDLHGKTPLHQAIGKNDEDMTCFLLHAGALIEARDIAQRTPLFTAIECRLENMVYRLLEFGADASARDKNNRDALGVAQHAARKSPEITKLLTKHKKNSGIIGSSSGNSDSSRRGSWRDSNAMSTTSTAVSSFTGMHEDPSHTSLTSPRPESSKGSSWWSRKNSKSKIKR